MSAADRKIPMRTFLTSPGEPLLSVPGPVLGQRRLAEFTSLTGLRPSQIVVSPLCAIPLPLFVQSRSDTVRRFPGMNPAALWHPMFWLPTRLRGRYRFADDDGSTRMESDDEWALRLGLELTVAGLYDEASGQWADVLEVYGLDVSDQRTVDRLAAWLAGNADGVLDHIDLSSDFSVPDDTWSLAWVNEIQPDLEVTRWMVWAEDLSDHVDSIDLDDAEKAHSEALIVAELAMEGFRSIPDYTGFSHWQNLAGGQPLHPGDSEYLDGLRQRLAWANAELDGLQEAFRPAVQALAVEVEKQPHVIGA